MVQRLSWGRSAGLGFILLWAMVACARAGRGTPTVQKTPQTVHVPAVKGPGSEEAAIDVLAVAVTVEEDGEVVTDGRELDGEKLVLDHCTPAWFDGERLVAYGVDPAGLALMLYADYRGVNLSRGGDNKLVRFLAPGAETAIPLALDRSVSLYVVTVEVEREPSFALWIGAADERDDRTVLRAEYVVPRTADGEMVTVAETHELVYYEDVPVRVQEHPGCE